MLPKLPELELTSFGINEETAGEVGAVGTVGAVCAETALIAGIPEVCAGEVCFERLIVCAA